MSDLTRCWWRKFATLSCAGRWLWECARVEGWESDEVFEHETSDAQLREECGSDNKWHSTLEINMFSTSIREKSTYESFEENDFSFNSLQPMQYGVRVARRKAIFESLSSDISSTSSTSSTSSESSPRLARRALNASCRNFLAFQTKDKTLKNKKSILKNPSTLNISDRKVIYQVYWRLLF